MVEAIKKKPWIIAVSVLVLMVLIGIATS